jgi:glutaredoxin-like YruB-family protein
LILFSGLTTPWADIYKWVDENGVTHYADTPPQVDREETEPSDEDVAKIPQGTSPATSPSSGGDSEQNPQAASESIAGLLDEANEIFEDVEKEPQVEIYVTSWCPYCDQAKAFFRSRGIRYAVFDVEKDENARRRMMRLSSSRAVPFVMINGQTISGFSEHAYQQALNQ